MKCPKSSCQRSMVPKYRQPDGARYWWCEYCKKARHDALTPPNNHNSGHLHGNNVPAPSAGQRHSQPITAALPQNPTAQVVPPPRPTTDRGARRFEARPISPNHGVRFLQSVALPAEMVDLINSSDNSDEILRSASQWRLDYPTNKANKPLSAKLQSTLGVLEKIFTRGKITTLTKKVEDILFDESSIDNIENEFGSALERLALTKSLYQSYLNYSATEQYERDLLETILVPQYGKSIYPFVTHQPLISGLLNADLAQFAEQRADF